MRKLLIAVIVGTVLAVAGLVTAALIRQTEPAASTRRYPRGGRRRIASERVGDPVASTRRYPGTTGPHPTPTPADSEPRFAYEFVGGIAGRGDRLTITSAGKVILFSPWEPFPDSWNISSSRVAELTDLFNRLDFMHMRTTPSPPIPDGVDCHVTYRYRGLMKSVAGGMDGPKRPFLRCLGALESVVSECRRVNSEKTLADSPARVDSITVDGKPVTAGSTVIVDSRRRPYRISWRGVGKEGCTLTGFAIAIRWDGRGGNVLDYAHRCPDGNYDYTSPSPGKHRYVTPVVYFSDETYSCVDFEVVSKESTEWKMSKRNRVGSIAVDGKPVAPGDTVRVEGGRSRQISWRGICADGCEPMRFSLKVVDGRNGEFLGQAYSCMDGHFDYTFPVSEKLFRVVLTVFFTDSTWAQGNFFVTSGGRP